MRIWLICLSLVLCGVVFAEDIVEFDEFGNPIESTEIPADQIPPDTRPPVDMNMFDLKIELTPIITERVDATIVLTSEQLASIFDNDNILSTLTGSISILNDNEEVITIIDTVRRVKTTINKKTGMATITDFVTGVVKVVPYGTEITDKGLATSIQQSEAGIKSYITFIETAHPRNWIVDKRTLDHMGTIENTPEWKEWQAIYAAEYQPIVHVPIADITQIKMIAEMKVVEDGTGYTNLISELKHFRTLGYNTVLAIWEGERLSDLQQQISLAKSLGYKVFFSYGKREKLTADVYITPSIYKHGLASLAAMCDGYIIGWRRTSLHLLKKDDKFVSYSMQCVREGNPTIPILGECYFGYQGNNHPDGSYNETEFRVNIPANASGAIVVNLGVIGVHPKGVLKLVRAESSVPLVILVVGHRPYYMTTKNNGLSKTENRTMIEYVEARFRSFDFGTATLSGDGSNEIYNKDVSDDLSKTPLWSK